jgi:hypothetical protein
VEYLQLYEDPQNDEEDKDNIKKENNGEYIRLKVRVLLKIKNRNLYL